MTLIVNADTQHYASSGRTPNDDSGSDKLRAAWSYRKSLIAQFFAQWSPSRYAAALNDDVFVLVRRRWGQVQTWTIPLPKWLSVKRDCHSPHDPLTYLIRRWSRRSMLGQMPIPRRVLWVVDSVFQVCVSDYSLPELNPHKMRERVKQLTASVVPCDLDTTFWSFTYLREQHIIEVQAVSLPMIEVPCAVMAVMGGEIDQIIMPLRPQNQWQKDLSRRLVHRAANWHPLAQQALIGLFDESLILKRRVNNSFKIGQMIRLGCVVLVLYVSLEILNNVIEQAFFSQTSQARIELADLQQQKIAVNRALLGLSVRDQQLRQQQKNQIQRDQRMQQQSQTMSDVVALWASIPIHSRVEFLRWEKGRLTVQLLTRNVAEVERWRDDWSVQKQKHAPAMQKIHLRQIQKDRDAQWRVTVFLSS